MPASYAPLPGARYAPEDAQRELDEAFDSEDDDQDSSESTPLTRALPPRSDSHSHPPLNGDFATAAPSPQPVPGGYDFERDYDYPPPGSPPGPSASALPNDIGNTNGLVPTGPVQPPQPRISFWRRAAGALLPQHYVRVPMEAPGARIMGAGTENDGVFANVSAKPSRGIEVTDVNGEVHIVPEEVQKETPPSYAEAQADAVPPYWETTVHAPAGTLDPNAYMIVDDLPSGPIFSFIMTAFVSYFFQFAGFVLTYLLHTTHAAKYGSRAGLGITLIQFGLMQYGGAYRNGGMSEDTPAEAAPTYEDLTTQMTHHNSSLPFMKNATTLADMLAGYNASDPDAYREMELAVAYSSRDWVALMLMTIGWFLLLSSCVGFYRVKRWESSIRAASLPQEPITPEQRAHDEQVRRNIEIAFGFVDPADEPVRRRDNDENEERRGEVTEAELRLTRTLQAAGLL